ncbi:MAG: FAD-dependent oxidoreductase, partial [Cyanobium sp.]
VAPPPPPPAGAATGTAARAAAGAAASAAAGKARSTGPADPWIAATEDTRQPDPTGGAFLTLVAGGAIASACLGAGGDLQLGWLLGPEEPLPQRPPAAWAEAIAALAPPPLAALLRQRSDRLGPPQRFAVQVAQARRWQRPGVLLLGDAAHPMSPVRAQGINQALRDSLVAAQELLAITTPSAEPPDQASLDPPSLDRACRRIEARRRPEISRVQALQQDEARQGQWIGRQALPRQGLALGAALLGPVARGVWMARQRPLREGALWL